MKKASTFFGILTAFIFVFFCGASTTDAATECSGHGTKSSDGKCLCDLNHSGEECNIFTCVVHETFSDSFDPNAKEGSLGRCMYEAFAATDVKKAIVTVSPAIEEIRGGMMATFEPFHTVILDGEEGRDSKAIFKDLRIILAMGQEQHPKIYKHPYLQGSPLQQLFNEEPIPNGLTIKNAVFNYTDNGPNAIDRYFDCMKSTYGKAPRSIFKLANNEFNFPLNIDTEALASLIYQDSSFGWQVYFENNTVHNLPCPLLRYSSLENMAYIINNKIMNAKKSAAETLIYFVGNLPLDEPDAIHVAGVQMINVGEQSVTIHFHTDDDGKLDFDHYYLWNIKNKFDRFDIKPFVHLIKNKPGVAPCDAWENTIDECLINDGVATIPRSVWNGLTNNQTVNLFTFAERRGESGFAWYPDIFAAHNLSKKGTYTIQGNEVEKSWDNFFTDPKFVDPEYNGRCGMNSSQYNPNKWCTCDAAYYPEVEPSVDYMYGGILYKKKEETPDAYGCADCFFGFEKWEDDGGRICECDPQELHNKKIIDIPEDIPNSLTVDMWKKVGVKLCDCEKGYCMNPQSGTCIKKGPFFADYYKHVEEYESIRGCVCDPGYIFEAAHNKCIEIDPNEDTDGDGKADTEDNCAEVYNQTQGDADSDKAGDICDNCPKKANSDQLDSDLDGLGNACDNCPVDFNPDQKNSNSDGKGDACTICEDPNADWDVSAPNGCGTCNKGFEKKNGVCVEKEEVTVTAPPKDCDKLNRSKLKDGSCGGCKRGYKQVGRDQCVPIAKTYAPSRRTPTPSRSRRSPGR